MVTVVGWCGARSRCNTGADVAHLTTRAEEGLLEPLRASHADACTWMFSNVQGTLVGTEMFVINTFLGAGRPHQYWADIVSLWSMGGSPPSHAKSTSINSCEHSDRTHREETSLREAHVSCRMLLVSS